VKEETIHQKPGKSSMELGRKGTTGHTATTSCNTKFPEQQQIQ